MSDTKIRNEVEQSIVEYERATGHAATRTRQMIERRGEIGALSQLMLSPDLQQGFKALRDDGQLGKTFEAIVVRHPDLFAEDVARAAQWRLDNQFDLL